MQAEQPGVAPPGWLRLSSFIPGLDPAWHLDTFGDVGAPGTLRRADFAASEEVKLLLLLPAWSCS